MIVFPSEFVATEWNGYFWNVETKELYSLKSGVLRRLGKHKPYTGMVNGRAIDLPERYVVSVDGERKTVPLAKLMALTVPDEVQVIPVG